METISYFEVICEYLIESIGGEFIDFLEFFVGKLEEKKVFLEVIELKRLEIVFYIGNKNYLKV